MSAQEPQTAADIPRLLPGDILAVETENGTRHMQVTHVRAPYPDLMRAIEPARAEMPEEIAKGRTAFIVMVETARALREEPATIARIGTAPIPPADRTFPTFRLPIRDKAGDIVYWWTWDGEGLTVAPQAGETDLPIREVMAVETLRKRLAALG